MGQIPRDVVAVAGCTCPGSLDKHLVECDINDLTEDQYAAVDAARQRLNEYMGRLNGGPHG